MKLAHSLVILSLVGTLALYGCGTSTTTSSSNDNGNRAQTTQSASQEKTASSDKTDASSSDIKAGVNKMLSIAKDLKKQIEAGDKANIKVTGPQLEDAWHSFEDSVKAKYPDIYEGVEKSLDPTVAGSKASPLDKQTLAKLDDQLIQALNDLVGKLK
jgi:iron uptake system EfeUOB component EfeO/EfeM